MQEKIEKVVAMIKENPGFAQEFKAHPVQAVEKILGKDLPDEMVQNIIDGVKAKVNLDKAGDLLGGVKKLF